MLNWHTTWIPVIPFMWERYVTIYTFSASQLQQSASLTSWKLTFQFGRSWTAELRPALAFEQEPFQENTFSFTKHSSFWKRVEPCTNFNPNLWSARYDSLLSAQVLEKNLLMEPKSKAVIQMGPIQAYKVKESSGKYIKLSTLPHDYIRYVWWTKNK